MSWLSDLFGGAARKQAEREARQVRKAEEQRQGNIRQGTSRIGDIFSQFNPQFFDQLRDSYTGFAMPQLDDQFGDARKQLLFSLDRSGTTESSSAANLSAELMKRYGTERQGILDKALGYRSQSMADVEGARSGLISTLNATGDAEGAANSAMARATALSQPTPFSPIANLFADFTGALGTQAAAERSFQFGGPKPTFNTGMFGLPSGSTVVRR